MDEEVSICREESKKCVGDIIPYLCLDTEFKAYWDTLSEGLQATRLDAIANFITISMHIVVERKIQELKQEKDDESNG